MRIRWRQKSFWMTTEEAARAYGYTQQYIHTLVDRGHIEVLKYGRNNYESLYLTESLERYYKGGNVDETDSLVDVSEAAEILDVHPNHVKRIARSGAFPKIKIGLKLYFSRTLIERYRDRELQDNIDQQR